MFRRTFLAAPALLSGKTQAGALEQAFREKIAANGVRHAVLAWREGGKLNVWAAGAARPDSVFLLASITKPLTAIAVMKLVDQGKLDLADPVEKHLPAFRHRGVTLRHLLTHTSGLPDMLPENEALRKRHAPLKDFVAGACETPLLFRPGAECRYQSMGILLAAAIVERVAKTPLPAFLAREVYAPLGMKATSLGLGGRAISATVPSQVTGNDDWNWNSPYWRSLGAPWGGAHAPAEDIVRLLEYFLAPDARVLRPETARRMVEDQNAGLNKPWGIGFAVNARRAGGDAFGAKCSERAFGHSGSTGTLAWADPENGRVCVLLTSRPAAEIAKTVLHPLSTLASE